MDISVKELVLVTIAAALGVRSGQAKIFASTLTTWQWWPCFNGYWLNVLPSCICCVVCLSSVPFMASISVLGMY